MRRVIKILAIAGALATSAFSPQANAAFYGAPRALKFQMARLNFNLPSLAPMAYTLFCVRNQDECRVSRTSAIAYRLRDIAMTPKRWAQLERVNHRVNAAIEPMADTYGSMETWRVSPNAGNCHDYAVTKRHELRKLGWPSRALLLSEVVTSWGEHHLVLVVRTSDGDLVLDNLRTNVRPVASTRYQWVRAQSPRNPNFWSSVRVKTTWRTASAERDGASLLR